MHTGRCALATVGLISTSIPNRPLFKSAAAPSVQVVSVDMEALLGLAVGLAYLLDRVSSKV